MTIVLQIAENILLLSFVALGYFLIESNRDALGKTYASILHGLMFGLIAALVTAVPVTMGDGATIDSRAGPIILAGIIAGPLGAVIAGLTGAIARGLVGGSFAVSGVAVYAVYALAGLALGRLRIVTADTLPSLRSISIIALTSMLGAGAMYFLIKPTELAVSWLQNILPLILVANTASVAMTALAISITIVYLRNLAELLHVNETLNLAKRAAGLGTWDYDIVTGALKWDQRSQELHGVDSESITGTYNDWSRNIHPDDLHQTQEAFANSLSSDVPFDVEYRILRPGGGQTWIKGDAIIIRDSNGQAVRVVGSNFDLTAIRKTEAELKDAQSVAVQAQKMETIGQLTGGVAHDFNNLLAVIMGNLELLTFNLNKETFSRAEAEKCIEDSMEAAQRGAELTQNMLAYARKAQLMPVPVNLNEVVRQTEKWISRTIDSSVQIETILQEEIWLTMADKSSLQSVLVNMLVNARDAVEGSGSVVVETANVKLDKDYTDKMGERLAAGRYVKLAIIDDGIGMDEPTTEKIFDPFFSTKPVGQGTGLGLSMVQGFVKQSRGTIRVQSEPGRGTMFELYFPAIIASSPADNQK